MATHIPVREWARESAEVIATALAVIDDVNEQRK